MEKYVPLSKKSKKEQKKFLAMQRNTWGGLNPATRTVPNGKAYDRNRQKQEDRRKSRDFRYEDPAFFMPGYRVQEKKELNYSFNESRNKYSLVLYQKYNDKKEKWCYSW